MGMPVVVDCPECGHDDNVAIAHDIDGLIVACTNETCQHEFLWENK